MKVDHAPAIPQRSLSDKIGEALVHTVEFLVPPLKKSLAWDRSEFEPMFPVRRRPHGALRLCCKCSVRVLMMQDRESSTLTRLLLLSAAV